MYVYVYTYILTRILASGVQSGPIAAVRPRLPLTPDWKHMAPPTTGSHAPGWEIPFGRALALSPAITAVRQTQPRQLPRMGT